MIISLQHIIQILQLKSNFKEFVNALSILLLMIKIFYIIKKFYKQKYVLSKTYKNIIICCFLYLMELLFLISVFFN